MIKTASVMQAQHNLAALLREIERGQTLVITNRRRPVARLSPVRVAKMEFPDFKARAARTWSGTWRGAGSLALLDESRGSR
ncbi:MAG: type II toxin-antitoxin system Phd/YefM family antitoxin [Chthoniobacterales bacterium]